MRAILFIIVSVFFTSYLFGQGNRYSDMGPDGDPAYDARYPSVCYNSTDNQYLVVWAGNDGVTEWEIHGQLVDANGNEVGSDFVITNFDNTTSSSYDAGTINACDCAYNSTDNEFMVVAYGTDSRFVPSSSADEIYGQRVSNTGTRTGSMFRISNVYDNNTGNDARRPKIAYNSTDNEYFVVWEADNQGFGSLGNGENEVWGQRISATGTSLPSTTDVRISDMGPDGDVNYDADNPNVAYNSTDNEYMVVWDGDDNTGSLLDGEEEVYGQRVSAAGAEVGSDIRLTTWDTDGTTATDAINVDIAYNSISNNYMIVFQGVAAGPTTDIWGEVITAAGVLSGSMFQISNMCCGASSYTPASPSIEYNSSCDEFLVSWRGETATNGEYEIFGEIVDASGTRLSNDDFQISDLGPSGNTAYQMWDPISAANTTDGGFLTVWEGEHDAGDVDQAPEVYGDTIHCKNLLAGPSPGGVSVDLELWLRADEGTDCSTNLCSVGSWDDQSTGDNHATATNTPTYVSNGVNYNPAIDLNGTDEYFSTTNTSILGGSTAYTKLAVFVHQNVGAAGSLITGNTSDNEFMVRTNGQLRMRHSGTVVFNGSSITQDIQHLGVAKYGVGGEDNQIRLDGLASNNTSTVAFADAGATIVGGRANGTLPFDGYIAEAIVYSSEKLLTDVNLVETYLAVKYGITLDNSSGGTAGDYTSTDGTTVWDASDNSTYQNNVIGVCRDDTEELTQHQSHSIDDSVRIYIGPSVAATNNANTGSFGVDLAYVMIGDNQGKLKYTAASLAEMPAGCGLYSRIEREWKVTRTANSQWFHLEIALSSGAQPGSVDPSHLRLLVDDDGDFSNGGTTCYQNGDNGLVISYSNPYISIRNIKTSHIANNTTRYITIASIDEATPLPIALVNFSSVCDGDKAVLSWETTSEINNEYFTIQSSDDGINFVNKQVLNGGGNSSKLLRYSWKEYDRANYYRLKQTDFDGSSSYSKIIGISCDDKVSNFNIYPNPFTDIITIELNEKLIEEGEIEIYDQLGRIVFSKAIVRGQILVYVELENSLPSGMYIIKLKTNSSSIVKRIIKSN